MERTGYAIFGGVCFRVHYNEDYDCITISEHAVDRYMEYFPGIKNRHRAEKSVRKLLAKSNPVVLRERYRAGQMARHGVDHDVGYRRADDLIFVLVDNELRTVHRNESGRWKGQAW